MIDETFYDFDEDDTDNRDNRDKKKSCKRCFPKHPIPKKILLECGCSPADADFDPCQCHPVTKTLDRVLIDTSCLCRPVVKIEFSSLVFFDVLHEHPHQRSFDLKLTFELFRICNGNETWLRDWVYRRKVLFEPGDGKIIIDWKERTPFTVTYCDRNCSDCCAYEMRVTSTKINDSSSSPDFDAVNVTKPNISALAQGLCY